MTPRLDHAAVVVDVIVRERSANIVSALVFTRGIREIVDHEDPKDRLGR